MHPWDEGSYAEEELCFRRGLTTGDLGHDLFQYAVYTF